MKASAILLFIGMIMLNPVHAALYKCKQADGTVIYTDQPCVSGEEMKLPSLQTYTPTPVPDNLFSSNKGTAKPDDKSSGYQSLTIIEPKNAARVETGGSGDVDIVVRAEPRLRTVKGHVFAIVLDGKQLPTTGATNTIRLKNVARGTHTAQILILAQDKSVVQTSNTVSFTIGRPSVYDGGRSKAPAAPGAPRAPRAPRAP